MNKIIKTSLIISILGLLSGCGGLSKQERLAIAKAKQERVLKRKKIREEQKKRLEAKRQAEIKTKKLAEEKKAKEEARKKAATVEALGYGNSKEEALKNAFSTAVSEYVGVLVDAKEVTKNGKLIEDKILTFSNGYIDSYKTISVKEQMGLWEVKISAIIKQQKVLSKIKTLKIKAIDIKDSKNRYAKIISQVKSKFDAEEVFVKLSKELMSIETFRKYINLQITGIDINIDEATRKYVPIYIKHKIFFNWDAYDKITNKVESIYKQLGGKIIHDDIVTLKNMTDSLRCCSKYDYKKNKFESIFVIVRSNNKLHLHVWKFPKSYGVIYPFQDKIFPNYWSWTKYAQDEKYLKIPNEAYDYQRYKISLLNKKKKVIFVKKDLKINDKQGWVFGGYYEIMSSIGEHRRIILPSKTSSVNDNSQKTKENLVYFDGIVKVKVPIKYIEQLKQIKIQWQ